MAYKLTEEEKRYIKEHGKIGWGLGDPFKVFNILFEGGVPHTDRTPELRRLTPYQARLFDLYVHGQYIETSQDYKELTPVQLLKLRMLKSGQWPKKEEWEQAGFSPGEVYEKCMKRALEAEQPMEKEDERELTKEERTEILIAYARACDRKNIEKEKKR